MTKTISSGLQHYSIKLDYIIKRIYWITSEGKVMSVDYHGENKIKIFAKHSYDPFILGILGNSLFLENRFSSDVFEVELLNMTQSKLKIEALKTDDMDRMLIIDKSRQPEGKIQISNTTSFFKQNILVCCLWRIFSCPSASIGNHKF